MSLDGKQKDALARAILDAFTESELNRLLSVHMNVDLKHEVGGENFKGTVFSLVDWAARQGRVNELIQAAYADNQRNAQIRDLYQESRSWNFDNPPPSLDASAPDFTAALSTHVERLRKGLESRPQQDERTNPYLDLRPYDFADQHTFFGRSRACSQLVARSLYENQQLTVLHARSGTGKTSLLKAGVIPRFLQLGHVPIYVRFAAKPVGSCIKEQLLPPKYRESKDWLSMPLYEFLRQVSLSLDGALLIFVLDQFEEFFTLQTRSAQHNFVQQLGPCLNDSLLPIRWIVSIRHDWFSELGEFDQEIPQWYYKPFRLGKLEASGARDAIVKPAAEQGVCYAPGLVDRLLIELHDDINERGIAPAELQIVCSRLFLELSSSSSEITEEMYTAAGGARGILRVHLDRVLNEQAPRDLRIVARAILEELIDANGHRGQQTLAQIIGNLRPYEVKQAQVENTLNLLVNKRLITVVDRQFGPDHEPGLEEVAYELVSDLLLSEIKQSPDTLARKQAEEILKTDVALWQKRRTHVIGQSHLKYFVEPVAAEIEPRIGEQYKLLLLNTYVQRGESENILYWAHSIGDARAWNYLKDRLVVGDLTLATEQLYVLLNCMVELGGDEQDTAAILAAHVLEDDEDAASMARRVLSANAKTQPQLVQIAAAALYSAAIQETGSRKVRAIAALFDLSELEMLQQCYDHCRTDLHACQSFFAAVEDVSDQRIQAWLTQLAVSDQDRQRRELAGQALRRTDGAFVGRKLFELAIPAFENYREGLTTSGDPLILWGITAPKPVAQFLRILFDPDAVRHNRANAMIWQLLSEPGALRARLLASLMTELNKDWPNSWRNRRQFVLKLAGYTSVAFMACLGALILLSLSTLLLAGRRGQRLSIEAPAVVWLIPLLPSLFVFGVLGVCYLTSKKPALQQQLARAFPQFAGAIVIPGDIYEWSLAQSLAPPVLGLSLVLYTLGSGSSIVRFVGALLMLLYACMVYYQLYLANAFLSEDKIKDILGSWFYSGPGGERRRNTALEISRRITFVDYADFLKNLTDHARTTGDWSEVDASFPLNLAANQVFTPGAKESDAVKAQYEASLKEILEHTRRQDIFDWIASQLVGAHPDYVKTVAAHQAGNDAAKIGTQSVLDRSLLSLSRRRRRARVMALLAKVTVWAGVIIGVVVFTPFFLMGSSWSLSASENGAYGAWAYGAQVWPLSLAQRVQQVVSGAEPLANRLDLLMTPLPVSLHTLKVNAGANTIVEQPIADNIILAECSPTSGICAVTDPSGRIGVTTDSGVRWLAAEDLGKVTATWLSHTPGSTDLWALAGSSLYRLPGLQGGWVREFTEQTVLALYSFDDTHAVLLTSDQTDSSDPSSSAATDQPAQRQVYGTAVGGGEWVQLAVDAPTSQNLLDSEIQILRNEVIRLPAQDDSVARNHGFVLATTTPGEYPFPFPIEAGKAGGIFGRGQIDYPHDYYIVINSEGVKAQIAIKKSDNAIYYSDNGTAWLSVYEPTADFAGATCGLVWHSLAATRSASGLWLYRSYTQYDGAQGMIVSRDFGRTWENLQFRNGVPLLTGIQHVHPICGELWR